MNQPANINHFGRGGKTHITRVIRIFPQPNWVGLHFLIIPTSCRTIPLSGFSFSIVFGVSSDILWRTVEIGLGPAYVPLLLLNVVRQEAGWPSCINGGGALWAIYSGVLYRRRRCTVSDNLYNTITQVAIVQKGRSGYRQNGLSLRKTAMPFIYITCVGINKIGESSGSCQHSFLANAYLTDCLWRVLYGSAKVSLQAQTHFLVIFSITYRVKCIFLISHCLKLYF